MGLAAFGNALIDVSVFGMVIGGMGMSVKGVADVFTKDTVSRRSSVGSSFGKNEERLTKLSDKDVAELVTKAFPSHEELGAVYGFAV